MTSVRKSSAVMGASGTRTRDAPRPSRGGSGGGDFLRFLLISFARLVAMDLGAMLQPVLAFFNEGIGKVIADVLRALYETFFPANSEGAKPVEIPK